MTPIYLISQKNYREALQVARSLDLIKSDWKFIPLSPPSKRRELLSKIYGGYDKFMERLVGDFSDNELKILLSN